MQAALKNLKSTRIGVTRTMVKERQSAAHDIKPDWDKVTTPAVLHVIRTLCSSIGCPEEFIFFPLLTATAAMLGPDTSIDMNSTWSEPAVVWTIVAGRKGEKKSAAMRLISNAVRKTEEKMQERFLQNTPVYLPKDGGYLSDEAVEALPVMAMTNSQFTFSKLHEQMAKNNGECLMLYDEIAALYEQLDHQAGGSQCDRKIMLSLYGGDTWSRASKSSGTCKVEKTHFNYTGFMQSTIAIAMLSMDDFDGFNDRHIATVCPERKKVYFENLAPIPESTVRLADILMVLGNGHEEKKRYKLDTEAETVFREQYNYLEDKMEEYNDDEDHRGVLSKAQGQTARLALVLHCLNKAVIHPTERPQIAFVCPSLIGRDVMISAVELMNFCIKQKFALMSAPSVTAINNSSQAEEDAYGFERVWEVNPRNVKSILEHGKEEFTASYVCQRRLLPPVNPGPSGNKYPAAAAKAYLHSLAEAGLVDIVPVDRSTSNKRATTLNFRKRKFEDLDQSARDILQKINVTEQEFSKKKSDF